MSMSTRKSKIAILGKVFEEFRQLLKDGKLKATSFSEQKFIDILNDVLENEDTDSYKKFLLALDTQKFNTFYDKVQKLVASFSTRIPMNAEKSINEMEPTIVDPYVLVGEEQSIGNTVNQYITDEQLAKLTELTEGELAKLTELKELTSEEFEEFEKLVKLLKLEGLTEAELTEKELTELVKLVKLTEVVLTYLGFSNVDATELNRILQTEGLDDAVGYLREKGLAEKHPSIVSSKYFEQQISTAKFLMEKILNAEKILKKELLIFFDNTIAKEGTEKDTIHPWTDLGNMRFKAKQGAKLDHLRQITRSSNWEYTKTDGGGCVDPASGKNLQIGTIIIVKEANPIDFVDKIDYAFIANLEGFSTEGDVPQEEVKNEKTNKVTMEVIQNSGVTIATGFDIGQYSEKQLKDIFHSNPYLRDLYIPYADTIKNEAVEFLKKNPLKISVHQAFITDALLKPYLRKGFVTRYYKDTEGDFNSLPA